MTRQSKRRLSVTIIMLLCLIGLYNESYYGGLSLSDLFTKKGGQRRLQFGDDSNVLGVQFAIFHIPVPNYKYNREKFSPAEYEEGMAKTCSKIEEMGYEAFALGDQEYINNVAGCEWLKAPAVGAYNLDEMKYQELSWWSDRHLCRRKFGTDKHEHRRVSREISLVYLNRLEALCDLALNQPDHLTILLDTNFDESLWVDVEQVIQNRLADPTDHSITTSKYPTYGHRSWFGRDTCQDYTGFPTAKNDFIAIRGKDCPAHRQLYENWLDNHLEYTLTLMPGVAKGCPCYDDEKVFHYMNVHEPGSITFVVSDVDAFKEKVESDTYVEEEEEEEDNLEEGDEEEEREGDEENNEEETEEEETVQEE